MTSSTSSHRPGEFELIRKLFAPLSRALPGAFALTDDVAILSPPKDQELVLKTDALVEGVHFRRSDPPGTIAKKALRVNLSDFAAKGATPRAYLLALALPDWPDLAWLEQFAGGLGEDQDVFEIALAGGDTVRTPGAMTIAVTMTGFVPNNTIIRRSGAKAGDDVYVTGTIGDSGAGLRLLESNATELTDAGCELVSRYHVPRPRIAFGRALRGLATASLDVSDGLVADLAHIADVSAVKIEIGAGGVPLSPAYRQLAGEDIAAVARAATSGDDYEIAFTAPPGNRAEIARAATSSATQITCIGRVAVGEGVVLLDRDGREIALARKGYTHF
jgi:thiamine-monophosphate kinase